MNQTAQAAAAVVEKHGWIIFMSLTCGKLDAEVEGLLAVLREDGFMAELLGIRVERAEMVAAVVLHLHRVRGEQGGAVSEEAYHDVLITLEHGGIADLVEQLFGAVHGIDHRGLLGIHLRVLAGDKSSFRTQRPRLLPFWSLQARQLTQPRNVRSYRWTISVSAPTDAAPSSVFFSSVSVFQFLRGLPLIAMTFMMVVPVFNV